MDVHAIVHTVKPPSNKGDIGTISFHVLMYLNDPVEILIYLKIGYQYYLIMQCFN